MAFIIIIIIKLFAIQVVCFLWAYSGMRKKEVMKKDQL